MKEFFSVGLKKCQAFIKKDKHLSYTFIILIGVLLVYVLYQNQEIVSLKQKEIVLEVHTDLDLNADTYLEGIKHPEKASMNFADVNSKEVGEYAASISYMDVVYEITFIVKDTKKPIIDITKNKFVFRLNSSLREVNEIINEEIIISDNYDTKFDPLEVLQEIPAFETELELKLVVKDTAGNESDPAIIYVQFTEDGMEKDNLEKVEVSTDSSYRPSIKPENPATKDKDTPTSGGTSSGGNTNSGANNEGEEANKPDPRPEPTPPVTSPEQKPTTPEPEPSREIVYKNDFGTWDEADKKVDELTNVYGNPWWGYDYMIIPNPNGTCTLIIYIDK